VADSKDKSKGVEVVFEILEEEIDIAINDLRKELLNYLNSKSLIKQKHSSM